MTTYGITESGFVLKRQATLLSELLADIAAQFGTDTALGSDTYLGQLAGIVAERHALLWEALQDTAVSQSPTGAEGVFVDNILALAGTQRKGEVATQTNPTPDIQANGIVLPGLVLYGAAGTVIESGAMIQTQSAPSLNFTLDAAVTIQPAANAIQTLVFSQVPTSGSYTLTALCPSGSTATTFSLSALALPQVTQLVWPTLPTSGTVALSIGDVLTAPITAPITAAKLQAALQAISAYATATVTSASGSTAGFVVFWPTGPIPFVATHAVSVTFSVAPITGSYSITLGGQSTSTLPASATASQVQTALRLLPGFSSIGVSGSSSTALNLHFKDQVQPTVSITSNTTGSVATVAPVSTVSPAPTVLNPVQCALNTLIDPTSLTLPLADVAVSYTSPQTLQVNFGKNTLAQGQPTSGSMAQATLSPSTQTLLSGNALVNLSVAVNATGAPAQGIGSATCTSTGPNSVPSGDLTVIASPKTGWTGVNNPLDCLTGSDVESSTAALARYTALLSVRGNGSLAAIIDKVLSVSGVTAAIGFENTTHAALQNISFSSTPQGSFCVGYQGQTTQALPNNATSAQVQAALQALVGLEQVLVSGSVAYGFTIDFNGVQAGQAQPLLSIVNNNTQVTPSVRFGRPPKSFEMVVEGGADTDIAKAIFTAAPAGIASYGTPIAQSTASMTAGSAQLTLQSSVGVLVGQSVRGQGILAGSVVVALSGNTITLSAPALSTLTGKAVTFSTTVVVLDSQQNQHLVAFSRPSPILLYVTVNLLTDYYYTPGVASSGVNPNAKFNPATLLSVQSALIAAAEAVPIGGLLVAQGTGSLGGAFRDTAGILSYSLALDTAPNPTNTGNLQLLAEQVLSVQEANIDVSFS